MNRLPNWIKFFCGAVIVSSLFLPVRAWADDDDPPARVARMNYAQGSVSFQPGGEGDWVEAVPNRPLTTGDNLWTDKDSRAELHIGSTAIRLSSETSLTFLTLDDRTIQLRLADGSMMLRVRHLDDDDTIEVDTPNLAFQIQRNGEYRVDVNADGHTTTVAVIQGRGEAIGGGQNYTVVANQEAVFSGDEELNYDINQLPPPDDFDNWALERDRREDRADSANYVSREMTGYEDLDDYGRWNYTANYGPVWVPRNVPVDWAPYRYGHWVWVAPWGWTWVDDEPWGFAPFHYGRWCQLGGGWAWVPGPVVMRPVYAPALVAFVGGGGFHFSIALGGGPGVAWFPLAPGEVFVPAYHVSRVYVNQVNVTNTVVNVTRVTNVYNYYTVNKNTDVTRITYANQTARNAVTAVSRETFVNARPVARNVVQVQQREVDQAPVTHEIGVAPGRPSVIGTGRPTRVGPPTAVANRRVVTARTPAAPTVPLSQRQDPLVARPTRPEPPMANRPEAGNERPGQPASMGNKPDRDNERPNQPAPRPEWTAPRPQGPASAAPRPESQRPEPARPEASRPVEPRNNNEDRSQPPHPLTRPAPPVQPKSDRQAQEQETKQHQWQQQRERAAPPPKAERAQPKREEPSKPKREEPPKGSRPG